MTGRILVTGAAGFIGGHACELLLEKGWQVTGLDNFDPYYPRALKEPTVVALRERAGFEFVEGDLRDAATLDPLVQGAEVVLHLAARPGVRSSIAEPGEYVSANVAGTTVVLEACRKAGVRRLVFASSSSVYGDRTPAPFREDAPAMAPLSPYAATKRAGELLCQVYAHLHGFRVAAPRFFTVYGPRQRPDLAVHQFTRRMFRGEPLTIYGDGSAQRDYTHVQDIARGIVGAIGWTEHPEPGCEAFNLGGGEPVRLDALIQLLAAEIGVEPEVVHRDPPLGDARRTHADLTKSAAALGYRPEVGIEEGIRGFVRWYRSLAGTPGVPTDSDGAGRR